MSYSTWSLIRSDIDRYRYMMTADQTVVVDRLPRPMLTLRALVICQGLQASIVYRVGHQVLQWSPRVLPGRLLRTGLRFVTFVASRIVETITGISIAERAEIGPGLYIGHSGGVVVGAVTLGAYCTLSHGVTVGRSGRSDQYDRPQIDDRVWIGPGAVVTGKVHIGEDAVVGANSVVTRDVPARTAALGIPARLHEGRGSFDMVRYGRFDVDPERQRSLRELQRRKDPVG